MSEQLRESMSAALDGEADAFELRRVIDEASIDDELRQEWHRLHLLRDYLRNEQFEYRPALRQAVWDGLLAEPDAEKSEDGLRPIVVGGERAESRTWAGRAIGVAVAGLVAVLVVVGGGVFDSDSDQALQLATDSTPNLNGAVPVMYQQATDDDLQRQYGFVIHHIQQRAMNQAGVSSFVKMATFRNPEETSTAGDTRQ